MKITIVEVAKLAGVSIATVSRVMNGNYPVKKSTKARVIKAIEDLNFIPNMQARDLNRNSSSMVGVIVPSVDNMFFPEVITGIEKHLKENGYSMLLSCSKNSKEQEQECVNDLLSRNVAGIIIADPNTLNVVSAFYEMIMKRIPIIFINGDMVKPEFSNVCSDEEYGASEALNYLLSLNHTKIGFIRSDNSYSYDIKEKAFRNILTSKNLFKEEYIFHVDNGNSSKVIDNTKDEMIKRLQESDVSALLCCNDLMAIGVYEACNEIGRKIPSELSVIGCDNILLSRCISPKLTTIDQNTFLLGYNASSLLLEMLGKKGTYNKRVIINTKLIKRDSVIAK